MKNEYVCLFVHWLHTITDKKKDTASHLFLHTRKQHVFFQKKKIYNMVVFSFLFSVVDVVNVHFFICMNTKKKYCVIIITLDRVVRVYIVYTSIRYIQCSCVWWLSVTHATIRPYASVFVDWAVCRIPNDNSIYNKLSLVFFYFTIHRCVLCIVFFLFLQCPFFVVVVGHFSLYLLHF